jgi:peptidoglycan biosynthesis protein MviN/MurJ (putative lipid II flippase)
LALGTSIAAIFNAVVLLVLLRQNLGGLHEGRILGSLVRILAASAAMGAAAAGVDAWAAGALPGDGIGWQIVRVALSIGVAIAVLAAAAWALRIREFNEGMALVLRRFRRRSR